MKRVANATIIFWWASCKRIYMIELFFVYVIDIIHKKAEWRTMILYWLSSFEYDHNLKLILNFFDSKNTELIFENTIFYKTQYYCCLQLNSYMWEQLLAEKVHKIFIMYKHFSDLQIFIDNLYNTFWRLCNF